MRIRLLAADVDGTLTERRGAYRISIDALVAVRNLEDHGISVSLATGNGYHIARGLARYIGASGPVIAENGCIILWKGEVEDVCPGRPPEGLISAVKALGLKESWQNACRFHDVEFVAGEGGPAALFAAAPAVEDLMRQMGWSGRVIVSGYALHIQPAGGGKGAAVLRVANSLGLRLDEVAAVGDSAGDVDLLQAAGFGAAVGDADQELKRVAVFVASRPAGLGFAEVAEHVLSMA